MSAWRNALRAVAQVFEQGGLDGQASCPSIAPLEDDVLFAVPFRPLVERYPLFTGDDIDRLARYLLAQLEAGAGLGVLGRIEESRYCPSKKLMGHVGEVIRGNPEYVLLGEQLVAFHRDYTPSAWDIPRSRGCCNAKATSTQPSIRTGVTQVPGL